MNMAMGHLLAHYESARPLQVIAGRLPFLGETDTKVGEYILTHPHRVAELSSSELAGAAEVSEASLFRFLSRVGYSYNDLRLALVKHVELSRFFSVGSAIKWSQSEEIVERTEESIRGLSQAFAYLAPGEVHRAAQSIHEASCVQVCGLGPVSGPIAEIVAYKLNDLGCTAVIRRSIQLVSHGAAEPPSHSKFGRSSDVLLAISHSGCNQQLLGAIHEQRSRGGTSIALTNYEGSPIAEAATIRLITGVSEPWIRQLDLVPRLAQLMAAEILLETISRMHDGVRRPAAR